MKNLLTIISCLLALNLTAQEVVVEYPYNPDFENDGNVGVEDLLQLLSSFGMAFEVGELTIDEVVLSEWLQTISETLIAQQAMIDSLQLSLNSSVISDTSGTTDELYESEYSLGGHFQNLRYPDGFDGIIPIYAELLEGSPYIVPEGKNLYVLNYNGHSNDAVYVDDQIFCQNSSTVPLKFSSPVIIRSGSEITTTATSPVHRIIGYLTDQHVEPVILNVRNESFTVPEGKWLVTNYFCVTEIGNSQLFVNDYQVTEDAGSNTYGPYWSHPEALIFKEGDVLRAQSLQTTGQFNLFGYLVDEDYFESSSPSVASEAESLGLGFGQMEIYTYENLESYSEYPENQSSESIVTHFDFDIDGILRIVSAGCGSTKYALVPDSVSGPFTGDELESEFVETYMENGSDATDTTIPLPHDMQLVFINESGTCFNHFSAQWTPLAVSGTSSNEDLVPDTWTCGDSLEYEGVLYPTVEMNHNCWFAKNLSYLPEVHYPSDASDQDPRYYVWEYWGTDTAEAIASAEYEEYGVYYNRSAIESGGLCPSGWEIPDFYTWRQLIHAYAYQPIIESTPHFHTPRDLLDEDYEWNLGSSWQIISGVVYNGTGFGIVPSGYVNPSSTNTGNIFQVNANTRFAVKATSTFDGYPQIHIDGAWIYTYPNWGGGAISVRCIKD